MEKRGSVKQTKRLAGYKENDKEIDKAKAARYTAVLYGFVLFGCEVPDLFGQYRAKTATRTRPAYAALPWKGRACLNLSQSSTG